MPSFELLPYTNFHDLNLDWIMSQFGKVYEARDEAQAASDGMIVIQEAAEAARDAAEAAQVGAENAELNAQAAQGAAEYAANAAADSADHAQEIVDTAIGDLGTATNGIVSAWLAAHIDPSQGYVIDKSLTIENAAADARVTGLAVSGLRDFWKTLDITPVFEQGNINTATGEEEPSSLHVRTGYIPIPSTIAVMVSRVNTEPFDPAVYVNAYIYTVDDVQGFVSVSQNHTENFGFVSEPNYYARFTMRRQDNSPLAPGDTFINVQTAEPTDTDLTYAIGTTGYAADSGAVGDALRNVWSNMPGLDNTLTMAGNYAAGAKATGDMFNLRGIPAGGLAGQVLQKVTGDDYDVEWRTGGGGGGGGAVDSVNGMVGNVVLDATDVGALPDSTPLPQPSNSQPLNTGTASPGVSAYYSRADHIHNMPTAAQTGAIPAPSSPAVNSVLRYSGTAWAAQTLTPADIGAAQAVTEVNVSTSGAVTQAMDAGKIYHFTGAVSSLALSLNAPATGQIAQYHFDFESGATPAVITLSGVTWPSGSFTPEANKRYEVDILNGYGVFLTW